MISKVHHYISGKISSFKIPPSQLLKRKVNHFAILTVNSTCHHFYCRSEMQREATSGELMNQTMLN